MTNCQYRCFVAARRQRAVGCHAAVRRRQRAARRGSTPRRPTGRCGTCDARPPTREVVVAVRRRSEAAAKRWRSKRGMWRTWRRGQHAPPPRPEPAAASRRALAATPLPAVRLARRRWCRAPRQGRAAARVGGKGAPSLENKAHEGVSLRPLLRQGGEAARADAHQRRGGVRDGVLHGSEVLWEDTRMRTHVSRCAHTPTWRAARTPRHHRGADGDQRWDCARRPGQSRARPVPC